VSTSVDGNTVELDVVNVVNGREVEKVDRPEEMIDSDAKVRDERMRSEVGLDVLCDQKLGRYKDRERIQLMKFEFAENDPIWNGENFLTTS
jgi:hypothetical protein